MVSDSPVDTNAPGSKQPVKLSRVGEELVKSRFKVETEDDAKKVYEKWAKTYDDDSFSALKFDSPVQCARTILNYWPRNEATSERAMRLLDVGCGTGALPKLLKPFAADSGDESVIQSVQNAEIHGFDLSPSMLAEATKSGMYNDTRVASITNYPWPYDDSSADIVMCNGVLIYVKDSSCLDEFLRVTRRGGLLFLMIRLDGYPWYEQKISELEKKGAMQLLHKTETRNNFPEAANHVDDYKKGDDCVWYNIYVFQKLE